MRTESIKIISTIRVYGSSKREEGGKVYGKISVPCWHAIYVANRPYDLFDCRKVELDIIYQLYRYCKA